MKLHNIYTFGGTYPHINGLVVKSNEALHQAICELLVDIRYRFDPIKRPVPAILYNYRDVRTKCLVDLLRTTVMQLELLDSVENLVFTNKGFQLVTPVLSHPERLVRVKFTSNEFKCERLVPLCNVTSVVDNLFSREYTNKCLIIN